MQKETHKMILCKVGQKIVVVACESVSNPAISLTVVNTRIARNNSNNLTDNKST